jgi:glycosyltransferase involved in cell wall biosynthesis
VKKIIFLTYDLKARGGISYYSAAISTELDRRAENFSLYELKLQNRWLRALSVFWLALTAPNGACILSSHVNFLRAIVPLRWLKNLRLGVITYNKEVEAPFIEPILEHIDFFFPLFQSGRKRLQAKGISDERIATICNILEPVGQMGKLPTFQENFLLISRLDKFDVMVKGVFHLLRALRHTENVHLTIAGSGDAKDALEAYCSRHDINSKVTFAGYVDTAEKLRLLRKTTFFIHLSNGEGIPSIAVLESIEQGCIAILHNDGRGDIENLPENMPVILVNRHQSEKVAALLSNLSFSPPRKTSASLARAKSFLNNFSAGTAAQKILTRLEKK